METLLMISAKYRKMRKTLSTKMHVSEMLSLGEVLRVKLVTRDRSLEQTRLCL